MGTLTLAFWVAGLTIVFNLVLTNQLATQADGVLRDRAEAVAETITVSPTGEVGVHDTSADASIDRDTWIFHGSRLIEGPAATTVLGRQAKALATGGGRFAETGQPIPVRLYARPVLSQGRNVATLVTSVELGPYVQSRRAALLGSALLALLIIVQVCLVLRWAVSRALSPVQAMTQQAAAWVATESAGRFGDETRPTELAVLASTLDVLLARLAALLRHEQQLAAELSHELRTPLSRIIAETDLLRERPHSAKELAVGHASIVAGAEEMRDILETLLATARTETGAPTGSCDVAEVARALATRLAASSPDKTVRVVEKPGLNRAGLDDAVLERALAPVLDNAFRYAAHDVRVEVYNGASAVMIDVLDDGPGIDEAAFPHVFEPGRRADPADGHHGAGLGLALARRLLLASGGGISASSSSLGAAFHLRLPKG